MLTIDADAHVLESEHTWQYLDRADADYRPRIVRSETAVRGQNEWWLVDGRLWSKQTNVGRGTSTEAREMADVAARLRHMDALGIDVQVLYPTIFIRPLTQRPQVELALCKSYNRWLADIWVEGKQRLPWAAALPFRTMDAAVRELEWATQHGARAVFMRGLETDRSLSDPYFFPLFEAASALGVPICPHASIGSFLLHDYFRDDPGVALFKFPVFIGFHALLWDEIPKRFPDLRFGFIEVGAQWVPYLVHDLRRRAERRGRPLEENSLAANRIWVACQTNDDLPYVLQYAGPDSLVIGTDYGHADTSAEIEALRNLRCQGSLAPTVIDKILSDNPRALYGL
jgi:predicted TIM-barrel fold metal-dependent hydrolase